jgi:uncharacterized SAM-dependent methyltransferase
MARDMFGSVLEAGDEIVFAVTVCSSAELRFARITSAYDDSIKITYAANRPDTRMNRRRGRAGEQFRRNWTLTDFTKVVLFKKGNN